MKLTQLLKTTLDETRTQMLGAQVLFGFQLQGVFQDAFSRNAPLVMQLDAIALSLMVLTIGLLIAAPSQHRLVERGEDSIRLLRTASRFANCALVPFASAIGCDVYIVLERDTGSVAAAAAAVGVALLSATAWYGIGMILSRHVRCPAPEVEMETGLHAKIEQMLTEARVILPGAQAMLGFQFVITMTTVFQSLPAVDRGVHLLALAAVLLSVIILITPAAIHRMAFNGQDDPRFHSIGSSLVTMALIPLSAGITGDFYVAIAKILHNNTIAGGAAVIAFLSLMFLWFVLPLAIRAHHQNSHKNS